MTWRNAVSVRTGLGPTGDCGSSIRDFEWVEERMGNEEYKCSQQFQGFVFFSKRVEKWSSS